MTTTPDEHPLQLEKHLVMHKVMPSVQPSSLSEVYANAPSGHRLRAVRRFLKARYGTGKMASGEFVMFGFCDPEVTDRHIAEHAGKQAQQAFNKIYNDYTWYAVTKNKMLFETLMKGGNLPAPETVAIYDRKGRGAGSPVMSSLDAVAEFLVNPGNHPVFCKPSTGLMSIGAFRVDSAEDDVVMVNGRYPTPVREVCNYMHGFSKKGYLFQTVLSPHQAFAGIGIDVISTLRFVVLNREQRADLHSAVVKLPAPGEVADNFWRQGSVLGHVDLEDGTIRRAVLKTEKGQSLVTEEDPVGQRVLGFAMPDFEIAHETVLRAARFMPGVRVQSWDVALTVRGPVLLEVNFGGDLNLYQLASGKGVMNKAYCDVLREAGFQGLLPN